ncbi:hypothetical protein CANMA_000760 [Candida margitis]|uniref:uncharacterized protein n=1 Tax=Candida margitis TaxID=1775924 RepID=UPI002225CF1B|nr:uncharacterized protein CANMA_000760 [Candida margitis]KAI5970149.1 hypothetical protein CANMA_000760 [Candida margitis]
MNFPTSTTTTEITPPPQPQSFPQQLQPDSQHNKRRNDDFEVNQQRFKNMTQEEAINSTTEWPQFIHPDGGIVKISPWGSIREYTDPKTNETITKFEDCNFEEYSFKSETVEKLYQTPDTPQSLYHRNTNQSHDHNNPATTANSSSRFTLSPSNEVEGYVVDGYGRHQNDDAVSFSSANDMTHQYPVEQENYFGIGGEQMEEFDCSYNEDEDEKMI